jgi:hypothetical protein
LNPEDKEMLFEEGSVAFNGVLVSVESNRIFINYENGISFDIALNDRHDAFLILSYISEKFKGKTRGLLGVMDGDKSNEFTLPNGNILQLDPENDREIFNKFGQEWLVKNQTSVFTYANGLQSSNYVNLLYNPKFISDGIRFDNWTLEQLAIQKCGNNFRCLYDVSVTGELDIGELTLEFDNQIVNFDKENGETTEKICPSITITNGQVIKDKNELAYLFSCSSGYELVGPSKLGCLDEKKEIPICKEIKQVSSSVPSLSKNIGSFVFAIISAYLILFKNLI